MIARHGHNTTLSSNSTLSVIHFLLSLFVYRVNQACSGHVLCKVITVLYENHRPPVTCDKNAIIH